MKPPTDKKRRLIARIKPGGFLRHPLTFLRHSGWQTGDVLLCEVVDGYLRLCKPPSETAWRIERLRRRLEPGPADDSPRFSARNDGELSDYSSRSGRQVTGRSSAFADREPVSHVGQQCAG